MPKLAHHTFAWSDTLQQYELYTPGHPGQLFHVGDALAFASFLETHTSFAFVGQRGRLSVRKETRPRGTGYWYASQKQGPRTRKRYLGRADQVTFACLEKVAHALTSQPESAPFVVSPSIPTSELSGILLTSKLSIPRLPNALVERPRLLADLEVVRAYPFTLISASAGSGKTTLLSAWAASQHAHIGQGKGQGATQALAWLSLEELDDDPIRFWDLVIAALRQCAPTLGETALALLHSPQSLPLSTVLIALLQDVERNTQDIILILDDYHVIFDQAICDSMSFLLNHVPSTLHVVLVGRADPDLPLPRFRVRGQLLEIRDQDLRFTEAEASHFLREALGLPLSEEEVVMLSQRTEGWIAGLQLAALALRKRSDSAAGVKDFAGAHRYLLDYVQQDILAPLPQPLQEFLLQTSILPRMNAALCQKVTAAPDEPTCQHILEELERSNLFVVSLDEHRHWYRYHDLFREALLARLHARQPELVRLLHIRVADFYQVAGELREAIDHAFAAPDYPLAASLMEQAAEQFWVRGEVATMARWVLALPKPQVREHASLLLTTALYLLSTSANTAQAQRARVHTEVQLLMARVETTLRSQVNQTNHEFSATGAGTGTAFPLGNLEADAAEEALLQRHLRLLRMYLVLSEVPSSGDYERLSNMQQEIEEELAREEEVVWHMIPLACHFILHYTIRQEGASLVPQLLTAREQVSRSGSLFATLRVRQWLVVAAVEAGQLRLASEESQAAIALIEQMKGFALLKGYFELVQVEAWYQWNRLEEVRDLLHTSVHDAAAWQQLDQLAWGYTRLLQVALAMGDESDALLALHELEHVMGSERFEFHPNLSTLRVQWWLAQGQVREASDWATSIVFPQGVWEIHLYDSFPVVIRVYFAQQRWTEALELLERWSELLDRPANIRITITYLAQMLVALHHASQPEQTRVIAARLFALTKPEGYLRVYLDEGEPMRQALSALKDQVRASDETGSATVAIARPYVLRLLAAYAQEGQKKKNVLQHSSPNAPYASSVPGRVASTSPAPVEPLTRRELEVLRRLSEGASNQQIAVALVIQLSTVKKHVGNVLAKLGAESRTQAIAQARAFSLL